MTRERDSRRLDDSAAGWSEPGHVAAPAHAAIAPAPDRYRELEVAGRGGMGEVVVAQDRRLGRRVALKRVAAHLQGSASAARLMREAWVTARLEHPSIVPVYDADVNADGEQFYTMRWIEGRTLGQAIAQAPTRPARHALVRHFLAAAQAVAYAHSHGIVHRDLKPANILVGAFGETQVADWGLAGFVDASVARAFELDIGAPAAIDVTEAFAGTPSYMSPEQVAGEPADTRSDVWALGALLHELLAGTRLVRGADADDVRGRIAAGRLERDALHEPGIPSELRAIVEKATALPREARYRDASELAADLVRYLDGRRVVAHDYTTLELARRLVRRLRVPLLIGATALLVGIVAATASVRRIAAERERALGAEAATAEALAESRRTSAGSLAGQSVTAVSSGALAETELLAAHALALGDSVDARGALAAVRAGTPPAGAESFALPGCERVVPATWELALCHGTTELAAFALGAPARARWTRPLAARQLAVTSGGPLAVLEGPDTLRVLDPATGADLFSLTLEITTGFTKHLTPSPRGNLIAASEGRTLNVVDVDERRRRATTPAICQETDVGAITAYEDRFVVVCKGGAVLQIDARAGTQTTVRTSPEVAAIVPVAATVSADGRWLAVGGIQGQLVRLDLVTGDARAVPLQLTGAVRELGFLVAPDLLVVAGDGGPARLWDLAAAAELLRLPEAIGVEPRLVPQGLLTGGRRAARWRFPPVLRARALQVGVGLAALAVDPRGRFLALARSDGRLEVRDRVSGRIVHEEAIAPAVIKTLAFSPDGSELALSASEAQRPPELVSTRDWSRRSIASPPVRGSARRLAFDDRGELLVIHYAPPLTVASADRVREVLAPELVDLWVDASGKEPVMLAIDGNVLGWRAQRLELLGTLPGARLVAAWPGQRRLAGGFDTGVLIREADGTTRWLPSLQARLTALAVSPDGRFLLGGRSDGTIVVWRADGSEAAVLRGHRHRIATIDFAPDGLAYSAGWDGQVLAWELSTLDVDARTLVEHAHAAWALDLPLVLGEPVHTTR